ncbi:MAG: exopolysaccharide biosynthesis protein [Parvularculaceae bacterium]
MRVFDESFPGAGAETRPGAGAETQQERRRHESATAMFEDIGAAGRGDRGFVRDMLEAMKGRAFGMAALVFALPVCFPMPPGVPTVAGIALLIVAVQMVLGNKKLWLPKWLREKSISRGKLQSAIKAMTPMLQRLEKAAKPRLLPLTGAVGQRVFGLVMLVLAFMLILPIPIFGNMPLGFAAAILAVGLIERDGWFVLGGLLATIVAILITGSFALLAVKAVRLAV